MKIVGYSRRAFWYACWWMAVLVVVALTSSTVMSQEISRSTAQQAGVQGGEVKFIMLGPGHFHAALVLKEMYPGVSKQVHGFRCKN